MSEDDPFKSGESRALGRFRKINMLLKGPKMGTVILIAEQILNTAWNFTLGMVLAREGGVAIFGVYSSMLAVFFFLAGPLSAMTTGINALDVPRLRLGRRKYLGASLVTSERIVILILPFTSILIIILGLQFTIPHKWEAIALGVLYIGMSFLGDLWRRNLALGNSAGFILVAAAARLIALTAVVVFSIAIFRGGTVVEVIAVGAVFITAVYICILRFSDRHERKHSPHLRRVTLSRQMRFGIWGFSSALVMYSLDQGLLIYAGLIGKSEIAAQVRSASYLFGLMNPVLLVFALVLPTVIAGRFGPRPSAVAIATVVAMGAIASAGIAALISVLSAYYWLPFLGPAYTPFAPISFWTGGVFACMMTRTIVMPFLKIQAPRLLFSCSVLGTIIGLSIAFSHSIMDAIAICHAMLGWSATLLLTNILVLVWVERDKKVLR